MGNVASKTKSPQLTHVQFKGRDLLWLKHPNGDGALAPMEHFDENGNVRPGALFEQSYAHVFNRMILQHGKIIGSISDLQFVKVITPKRKETRTPTSICANCGYETDATSNLFSGDTPKGGDISICIECGHLAAFNNDLTLRQLTDQEMIEVAGDQRILTLQKARAMAMEEINRKKK